MVAQVTQGIKVVVQTKYQSGHSQPENNHYVFSYKIIIENNSDNTVTLLRRHWNIFDSTGEYREVKGEGVIGQQPLINPGEVFEYESACDLNSEMGKMAGTYLMERELDKIRFIVQIPEFELIAPQRLN